MQAPAMKQLLVTVGTTKFENLIKSIDKEDFYTLLERNHFTNLIIQKGTGEYIPSKFTEIPELKLHVQVSELLNNFESIIRSSEYVISHGGAGILLECLKNKRKTIVCVNDTLMDNHQVELASSLDKERYVNYCPNVENVGDLLQKILDNESEYQLREYPEFNLDAIPQIIYDMLEI